MLSLEHFLVLSAFLFCVGLYGALAKRNAVAIMMAIELMCNAVTVAFVAFARYADPAALAGQVFAVFIITVAAAEVALALAIVLALYRLRRTINVEDIDLLRW